MMNAEFEMTEDESIQFEKDYERFSIIQDENNFQTNWWLYEIEDINENTGLSADYITDILKRNRDIKVELPNKELTWLDLWKYADELYKLIGDSDHMFIESFEVKKINGKRELQVFFGS